ncbi:DUF1127 domain-containing protein [Algicella marina]|uniref:DUF1127 domain-containing protein n=1 Tax=Algicella marina TaxID=2683284 RepID=A0A6P1T5Q7_9RHOB|nr:DUF1127 domain-containing protein [Algicella marina]QHQ35882.1 DUF1127 domain-containing protein [Algicella marina]
MAYLNQTIAANGTFTEKATAAFRVLQERYAQHKLYKRTLRELRELSARELADLGLSHANLHSIAYESVYGQ